jgi:hypothetical protein
VAFVVAPAEVHGDEAGEGGAGREIVEGFCRVGLEEGKVAEDGGLDERGPLEVGEDGVFREVGPEGYYVVATKEAVGQEQVRLRIMVLARSTYSKSNIRASVESMDTHSSLTFRSLSSQYFMMSLPDASFPGVSFELITRCFSGGQTVSQNSALTAVGYEDTGPPAVGPEMKALRGNRTGRKAKS